MTLLNTAIRREIKLSNQEDEQHNIVTFTRQNQRQNTRKTKSFVKECLTKITDTSFHTYPKECLTKITDKLVEENCSIGWWQSKPSCYLAKVSPHPPQKYAAFVYALAIFQNWNTYLVFLLNSTILIL